MSLRPEYLSFVDGDYIVHRHREVWLTIQIAYDWKISTYGASYGAAAAAIITDAGLHVDARYQKLYVNSELKADSETADLIATYLGLMIALDRWYFEPGNFLPPIPEVKHVATGILHTTIHTHSVHVRHIMMILLPAWRDNGWIDEDGFPIPPPRRRLIEATGMLMDWVSALGELQILEVPREQNGWTVQAVDRLLLEMER